MQVQQTDLNYLQLQSLSYEELIKLNATPSTLHHFVRSAEQPPLPMDESLDQIYDQVQMTPSENLELEAERQSERNQLQHQVDNFHIARKDLENTVAGIKNFTKSLIEFMQDESEADEKKSEVIAETFLDGGFETDQFLKEYLRARTVQHKDKVSAERVQDN